jgi:hypothetical protein
MVMIKLLRSGFLIIVLISVGLAGCTSLLPGTSASSPVATGGVPQLQPTVDPAEVKAIAQAYLDAWKSDDMLRCTLLTAEPMPSAQRKFITTAAWH